MGSSGIIKHEEIRVDSTNDSVSLSSENQISYEQNRKNKQIIIMPVPAFFYFRCVLPPLFTTSTACCTLHCIVSDGVENGIGIGMFILKKCSYTPPHPPPPIKKEHLIASYSDHESDLLIGKDSL